MFVTVGAEESASRCTAFANPLVRWREMEAELCSSLAEQLLVLGVELSPQELSLCAEVCSRRALDAEAFAEQWMAFSLSHGAQPDERGLRSFERKLTDEERRPQAQCAPHAPHTPRAQLGPRQPHAAQSKDDEDDILTDYLTTPKGKKNNHEHGTPKSSDVAATILNLQPETYSPAVSQSEKYSKRTNSGDVLCSFGNNAQLEKCLWTNMSGDVCNVRHAPNHSYEPLSSKAMYGFELLQKKASILDNNIKYISQSILQKANIKETVSVKCKSQLPITVVGRIDCDANGRLNPKSVLLQGTWEESMGHNISVDLDELKQYSLFPGQIVAMTGLNTRGNKFIAHEIYHDGSIPNATELKVDQTVNGPLQIIAACGPFTTSDSLMYEPLTDLIQYISINKPHAVILIGPFLDENHKFVTDNLISETYKLFFDKLIERIMSTVENSSPHTQMVLVSSSKDVFHTNIYPTPPFYVKKKYKNLTMVTDPALINIAGVNIGITATDILMHLSKEEISLPLQGPDKLGRLASHLFNQQNFYPLWPPNNSISLDTALWNEFGCMTINPHILIVPSDFRYFIKEINGCVTINPERLTKGVGGGTLARLQINSSESCSDGVLCQIIRI